MAEVKPLIDCPGENQLPVEVLKNQGTCPICGHTIFLDPTGGVLLQHLVRR